MFKHGNNSENKIDIIVRYFIFYSIFIFFVIFSNSSNILLKMLPNLCITLIFFKFLWNKNIDLYSSINLFLLGLIMDSYTFVPMFLSSFCLLVSYRLFFLIKKFLVNDTYFIYFIRDVSIFMIIFFVLKWFVLSYYSLNFLPFFTFLLNILFNVVYCVIFYIFGNKFLNNVQSIRRT